MPFSEDILRWYATNKRVLPWRNTKDPYKVWLSEVILQQTRVQQGLPYYRSFIEHYPTVRDLSESSEKKVLKLWQGLGYYSRARNLHATAKRINNDLNGQFPDNYSDLLKLKGVGDYTASAIASICFNEAEPVVDGNVYRVLSRFFAIELAIDSSEGKRYFKELAREVMDTDNPGEYNQAIMEFGAMVCVPSNPDCTSCPVHEHCLAHAGKKVSSFPVKKKKPKVRKRYFNYLVPLDKGRKTLLTQRKEGGIWQQLYQFPLVETEQRVGTEAIRQHLPAYFDAEVQAEIYQVNEEEIVHKLSHQQLHTRFWILELKGELPGGISLSEAEDYPVPVLIADFIKTLKNLYF